METWESENVGTGGGGELEWPGELARYASVRHRGLALRVRRGLFIRRREIVNKKPDLAVFVPRQRREPSSTEGRAAPEKPQPIGDFEAGKPPPVFRPHHHLIAVARIGVRSVVQLDNDVPLRTEPQ